MAQPAPELLGSANPAFEGRAADDAQELADGLDICPGWQLAVPDAEAAAACTLSTTTDAPRRGGLLLTARARLRWLRLHQRLPRALSGEVELQFRVAAEHASRPCGLGLDWLELGSHASGAGRGFRVPLRGTSQGGGELRTLRLNLPPGQPPADTLTLQVSGGPGRIAFHWLQVLPVQSGAASDDGVPVPADPGRLLPPTAAAPAEPVTLRHGEFAASGVLVELAGVSRQPDATLAYRALPSGALVACFRFTRVTRYARLLLDLPEPEALGRSCALLAARLRIAEGSPPVRLGVVHRAPGEGWRWQPNSVLSVKHVPEWQELRAAWEVEALPGQRATRIMLQFEGDASLEVAALQVTCTALDATAAPRSPALNATPSSATVMAGLALSFPGTGLGEVLVLLPPERRASGSWTLARVAAGQPPIRCAAAAALGPRLLKVVAPAAVAGDLLVLLEAEQPDLPPLPVDISAAEISLVRLVATYGVGRLDVAATLASGVPGLLHWQRADLWAGEQLLDSAELLTVADLPGTFQIGFALPCPRGLATQPLRLVLPRLGFELPVHLAPSPGPPEPEVPAILGAARSAEGALEGLLRLNRAGARVLHGWARDPEAPGKALVVDLLADGEPFATVLATANRRRVAERNGGSAVGGFEAEVPPNFRCGQTVHFAARPRAATGALSPFETRLRLPPHGHRPPSADARLPALVTPGRPCRPARSVAAVVLTQDAGDLLDSLLESIWQHDPDGFARIVVVDHHSADSTAEVLARHAARLPINVLRRPPGSSYAASNNAGAALCTEEAIVFLNNDVVLTGPLAGPLAAWTSANCGAVGIRLLDEPAPGLSPAPQHVGIHFDPRAAGGPRPFESRAPVAWSDAAAPALAVPAVTGAVLSMHRDAFAALGGFDDGYYYGWEDVDLCLRALAKGHPNVVLTEVQAIHLRGRTRRRMRSEAAAARRRNPEIFATRWAGPLRTALRAGLLRDDTFWTGRPVAIGFVVAALDAPDGRAAAALGQALRRALPCDVVVQAAEADAAGLDIIVVTVDDLDPRALPSLGPGTRLVAWPQAGAHRWTARSWRDAFELWLAPSAAVAEHLSAEAAGDTLPFPPAATQVTVSAERPDATAAEVAVLIGAGWGRHEMSVLQERLADLPLRVFGPAEAPEPAFYATCRAVIDAAGPEAMAWGVLDPRVPDALAAGVPVVSANPEGLRPVFGDAVPIGADAAALAARLREILTAPEAASAVIAGAPGMAAHAAALLNALATRSARPRIAIKAPAEGIGARIAEPLGLAIARHGATARVDAPSAWHGPLARGDDAVLSLAGPGAYEPQPGQVNLSWVVDDHAALSAAIVDAFDATFTSSDALVPFSSLARRPLLRLALPMCAPAPCVIDDTSAAVSMPFAVGCSEDFSEAAKIIVTHLSLLHSNRADLPATSLA